MSMLFGELIKRATVLTEAGKGVGVGNFELPSDEKPTHVPQTYIRTSLEDEQGNKPEGVKRAYIGDPRDLIEIKKAFDEVVTTLSGLDEKQHIGGPLVSILNKYYTAYWENRSRQSQINKTRTSMIMRAKTIKRGKDESIESHQKRQEASNYSPERESEEYTKLRVAAETAAENLRDITYECFSMLLHQLRKSPELTRAVEVLQRLQEFVRNTDKSQAVQLGKILQDFSTKLKTHGIKSFEAKAPLTVNKSKGGQLQSLEQLTSSDNFKGLDREIKAAFEAKNRGWERADELMAKLKNRINAFTSVDPSDKAEFVHSLNTNERRARTIYDMLLKKYSGQA
jgi:ribosomal protein L31E